jgi:hypothetical protein
VITVAAEQASQAPAPPVEPAPEAYKPRPADPAPPSFLAPPAARDWRWLTPALAVAMGLAVVVAGYQTWRLWLPGLAAAIRPTAEVPIRLNVMDSDGQLQIQWDGNSPIVREATNATLEIDDGPLPRKIQLDARHLKAGTFTYARQGPRVDLSLALHLPGGRQAIAEAIILATPPGREPTPEDPEIRKQRDALAQEAAKLKSDLAAEEARTLKLEKSLDDVKKILEEQQRKRLENQSPDR